MPCVRPKDAWYSTQLNESGKRSIHFDRRFGSLDRHLQVPCGTCVGCRTDQSRMWGLRMYHEASQHQQNSFLTVTYADAPPCLSLHDLQCFIKRLRHHVPFRYFACGEYGEKSGRPHYHLAVFGQDFLGGSTPIDDQLYTHSLLQDTWGKGFVSVGQLTLQSCMYVAGYVSKKLGDTKSFSTMSRHPGIGHDWLNRYSDDIRRTGVVVVEGREYPVPLRYMYWKEEEFYELKAERKALFDAMPVGELIRREAGLPSRRLNYLSRLSMKSETV